MKLVKKECRRQTNGKISTLCNKAIHHTPTDQTHLLQVKVRLICCCSGGLGGGGGGQGEPLQNRVGSFWQSQWMDQLQK